jgi:hypothetical protein
MNTNLNNQSKALNSDSSVVLVGCSTGCDDLAILNGKVDGISISLGDSGDCITSVDFETNLPTCPATAFGKVNYLSKISAKESTLGSSIYGLEAIKNELDSKPDLNLIEGSTILAKKSDLSGLAKTSDLMSSDFTNSIKSTIEGSTIIASSESVASISDKIGINDGQAGFNNIFQLNNLIKDSLISKFDQFGTETIYGKVNDIKTETDLIGAIDDDSNKNTLFGRIAAF